MGKWKFMRYISTMLEKKEAFSRILPLQGRMILTS